MPRITPEQFGTQLATAFGPALRAVVLYGSAVAGEHLARRSDYNVLIVVDELPLETLRTAAAVAKSWMDAGNPAPLIFTEEEWRSSADVFPMEYADILERHRVLQGQDPFTGIAIARANLRMQVEREARGKLLHLRSGVFAASANPRAQLDLLEATLSQIMVLFRGVVRLHGEVPPTDYDALTRATAQRAGFEAESVLRVVSHVRGHARVAPAAAAATLAGYLTSLEALVRYLDRYAAGEQRSGC